MPSRTHAYAALAILTALNFLNYVDRTVLYAVQSLIQVEFPRSDTMYGWLASSFILVYMVVAPIAGWFADRYQRRLLIVVGAIIWSGATLLTAVTHSFGTLFFRHMIVGVGEATFVTIAPAFISDLFDERVRGRMLAIFYLAIPVGSAMGFLLGSLGTTHGWRYPFYIGAAPGFLLGLTMLFVHEPQRGASDTIEASFERRSVAGLFHNRAFWTVTFGIAMMTYALGGLQVWMPTFLSRVRHVPLERANLVFGAIVASTGLGATLFGGWLGDRLLRRTRTAYYLISAVTMALGIPAMLVAIYAKGALMFPGIFVGAFLLLVNTSPLNAALVNSVDARIRATAVAVNIFVFHLLGDAFSPILIPFIKERYGFEVGFLSTVVAIALSAIVLLYGMRFAPRVRIAEQLQSQIADA